MLEQEFEKLLAAYFEDELDDAGLARLREAVEQMPARRRRFQRELRMHTLLRETGTVLLAKEQAEGKQVVALGRTRWRQVAALAACLALCGLAARLAWNHWHQPERIGRCLHVSNKDELVVWRNGRQFAAKPNTVLRVGDRLQTQCEAQTVLRVEGVGLLTLQSMNTLELFSPTNPVAVAIEQGNVLIEAAKRKPGVSPLGIRTPQSLVKVLGTVFSLEVEPTATRLLVHEGEVAFEETATGSAVQVGAGQYSVSGGPDLEVRDQSHLAPDALLPGQQRLRPVADAYFEGEWLKTDSFLKVEGGRRTAFLKFEVPNSGRVLGARLRLKQMVDCGSGTLQFWEGSHNEWTERTLSKANAPQPLRRIGRRVGWVEMGRTVEVDVSSLIRREGTYTLIVTLDEPAANDIWFGSRESPHPPELILTCQP